MQWRAIFIAPLYASVWRAFSVSCREGKSVSSRVRESCERLMDAAQARYGALVVQGEECVLVLREDLELLLATWEEKNNT